VTPDRSGLATDVGALAWLRWLLAPDPATAPPPDATPVERYRVLPGGRHPRVVVPLGHSAAARAVLQSDLGNHGIARRVTGALSRVGFLPPGVGAPLAVPAGTSLAAWLSERLDRPDLHVGITVGAPRPNRKPVLKLVASDGTVLAFAKVAWNPLTTALVANEQRWLERIEAERPAGITAPRPWLADTWKGMPVLITHPLAEPGTGPPFRVDGDLVAAIADLAPGGEHDLVDSPWWKAAGERVAALDDEVAAGRLTAARSVLAARLAGTRWRFGAWHGDLTAWNAHPDPGGVTVWDWERASDPVPVGFDAAHAAFQAGQVGRGLDVDTAAAEAGPVVAEVVDSIGLPPGPADDLVTCYLVERCLRWYEDLAVGSTTATPERQHAIQHAITARTAATGRR